MGSRSSNALGHVLYGLIQVVLTFRSRRLNLTSTNVLGQLERSGPVRLGELAASQVVTQPAMTATVDQLCRMGFAERLPDPSDGRVVLVSLTASGGQFLNEGRRDLATWVDAAAEHLGAADRRALERALPALRHLTDALAHERGRR